MRANPHGVFSVVFGLNPVVDLGGHIDMAVSGKMAWMTAPETVSLIAGIVNPSFLPLSYHGEKAR